MSDAQEARLQEITQHALDAAQLATEAAHEAEAAISARNEAAQALNKTAQQTRWLAMGTAAGALVVMTIGGLFWARASTHLEQAAEVQATASASFVENVMLMNDTLEQVQDVILAAQGHADRNEASLNALIARLDQRLEEITRAPGVNGDREAALPNQCPDLLLALAEIELNLTRQLADLTIVPSPVVPPAADPVAVPASRPAPRTTAPQPVARPAPPRPNPFRFP